MTVFWLVIIKHRRRGIYNRFHWFLSLLLYTFCIWLWLCCRCFLSLCGYIPFALWLLGMCNVQLSLTNLFSHDSEGRFRILHNVWYARCGSILSVAREVSGCSPISRNVLCPVIVPSSKLVVPFSRIHHYTRDAIKTAAWSENGACQLAQLYTIPLVPELGCVVLHAIGVWLLQPVTPIIVVSPHMLTTRSSFFKYRPGSHLSRFHDLSLWQWC